MNEIVGRSHPNITGNSETLLFPLYIRAVESQRPDALVRDDAAVRLYKDSGLDFSCIGLAPHDDESMLAVILRSRQFDRLTQVFLSQYPGATVVHLGCGLDSRFERLDSGTVTWYDLDLPGVIELRHRFLDFVDQRYHQLACSAFDPTWMEAIVPVQQLLVLAEGLFMYFDAEQVKNLVLATQESFPGSELVFDAFSPFYAWANNRRVKRTGYGSAVRWGMKNPSKIEGWGKGIHLIDAYYPFMSKEPRMNKIRWVRAIPLLSKTIGVYHYRLGELDH